VFQKCNNKFCHYLANVASRLIKEKTGARFIDVEPAAFVDSQYTERELWELTKEIWQALA
jgi:hypothetical protein